MRERSVCAAGAENNVRGGRENQRVLLGRNLRRTFACELRIEHNEAYGYMSVQSRSVQAQRRAEQECPSFKEWTRSVPVENRLRLLSYSMYNTMSMCHQTNVSFLLYYIIIK